ncbi:helix-turn-helix transcriptional regulator [Budviciaceae bacterium CWB-B4]|uniref:Helix-turn-helix transcriptional regulator n=1 Tax=Limnobaculum xujianqingii TaxID=2738837 RepID=A0A9D7FZW0_9GAMM|nr:helix-turn-helix transcriptional regulator [Limnobaculum xujianqingii]MBK5075201.1 helix-turn-helix transcriptional regulator [Limnobaculum xujianqingii]MBK5178505.1 helix-turn-helix transcriptional regulator [Limnobaculum xujianqingii]
MKTFSDRLNAALNAENMSQAQLAEAAGLSQPAIQKLTSGKAKSSRKVVEIARALNVRPEWLSGGIGEMREDFATKPRDGVPVSEAQGRPIKAWDSSDPLEDDEVEIPFYKSIELAAGNGRCVNEDYNGFKLRFSKATLKRYGAEPKYAAAFPVSGDSMAPVIPNGSTVTIDRNHTKIVDGGIYVIEQDELFRVKLLYRQPGGKLIIRSYNSSEFPDETAGIDTVKIIGRVINWSVMAW